MFLRANSTGTGCIFVTVIVLIASNALLHADDRVIEPNGWKQRQLQDLEARIAQQKPEEESRELVARREWLRQWIPGKMNPRPLSASNAKLMLVEEPSLRKIARPDDVTAATWEKLATAQEQLRQLDQVDTRKQKLSQIIRAAHDLDQQLSTGLTSELKKLPQPTAWALAFTRYRLGRALAYRELPVVRERWPIEDRKRYEQDLISAYERLLELAGSVRPEFILLEDRMLRRSGKKGLALQLLEKHQSVIDEKWYLKKRRDLLEELGWLPAFQEAARIYHEAGYRDEQ